MLSAVRRTSECDIEMGHRAVLYQTPNWIALSEDMFRPWTFTDMIMNFRVKTLGISQSVE
jgi:hypothetical protein